MAGLNWHDWFFVNGAGSCALLGVVLLALALFRDRSRGRKRCPKCWYDMSAATGFTCPECGKDAKKERRLFRTRRRWRGVAVALLFLIAGYGLWVGPRVREQGWVGAVPTWMLIAGMPWMEANRHAALLEYTASSRDCRYVKSRWEICFDELRRRVMERELDGWEAPWALARCQDGDERREPTTDKWWETYGQIYGELRSQLLTASSNSRAADLVLARVNIATREAYAPGAGPFVQSGINYGFEAPEYVRFVLARSNNVVVLEHIWDHRSQILGSIAGGIQVWDDRMIDLAWERDCREEQLTWLISAGKTGQEMGIVKDGGKRIAPRCVADATEIVEGVESEDVTRALTMLNVRATKVDGAPAVEFRDLLNLMRIIGDLTLALRIEVLKGDRVIASSMAWWANTNRGARFEGPEAATRQLKIDMCMLEPQGWCVLLHNVENRGTGEELRLRLTGDPAVALRDMECERYWKGQVIIPLGGAW